MVLFIFDCQTLAVYRLLKEKKRKKTKEKLNISVQSIEAVFDRLTNAGPAVLHS